MRAFLTSLLLVALSGVAQATVQTRPTVLKKAVTHISEGQYDEATTLIEGALKTADIKAQGALYYLIGIAQYETEKYDSALASFETALDISTDPKLDEKIDMYIERTIKAQMFYDNAKTKNKFSYFVGLGYDSNIINLNRESFADTNLGSVSALYGLNYSHRLINNLGYSMTPEVFVSDNYSLDTSFKATTTVQSGDALQYGLTIPLQFNIEMLSTFDSIQITPLYKAIMLPQNDKKRELAITSISLATKLNLYASETYSLYPSVSVTKDTSQLTYSNSDDDQSATRIDAQLTNQFIVSELKHRLTFTALGESNTAKGKNASYRKYGAQFNSLFAVVKDLHFGPGLKYHEADYYQRTTPRRDRFTGFTFDVNYFISGDRLLSATLGRASNNSSSEINTYQDFSFSVAFSDQINF
jgi:tetratricopeptide (TPR) repeat protein